MTTVRLSVAAGIIGLTLGFMSGHRRVSTVPNVQSVAQSERTSLSTGLTPEPPSIDIDFRSEAFDRNAVQAGLIDAYSKWSTAELKLHILTLKRNRRPVDEIRLQIALECLAEKVPGDFLRWIAGNYPGNVAQAAIENAIVRVGDVDPDEAFVFLRALPSSVRSEAMEALAISLVGGVSSIDHIPRSWFKEISPRLLAYSIAKLWISRTPKAVMEFAENSQSGAIRFYGRATIAESWASNDPEGAMAYLESLPDNASTLWHRRNFAAALAVSSPAKAADYAATHGFLNASTGSQIFFQWIQKDVAGAMQAADRIEQPLLKSWIESEAARHLAARNPALSLELLQSIESTTRRSQGLGEVARNLAQVNPEQVATLATSITSDFDRAVFLRGAVEGWKQWDNVDLSWMKDLDAPSRSTLERAIQLHAPELSATR